MNAFLFAFAWLAMYTWLAAALVSAFILYVIMFGASSTGFIGVMHDWLTGCYCLRPVFRRLCGPKCQRAWRRIEYICCQRPNPLLQCFYLALMGGGFILYYSQTLPFIPNPRLSEWHRYTGSAVMSGGLLIFVAACFSDPGAITAANLHRFSRAPYDNVYLLSPSMPAAAHAAGSPSSLHHAMLLARLILCAPSLRTGHLRAKDVPNVQCAPACSLTPLLHLRHVRQGFSVLNRSWDAVPVARRPTITSLLTGPPSCLAGASHVSITTARGSTHASESGTTAGERLLPLQNTSAPPSLHTGLFPASRPPLHPPVPPMHHPLAVDAQVLALPDLPFWLVPLLCVSHQSAASRVIASEW